MYGGTFVTDKKNKLTSDVMKMCLSQCLLFIWPVETLNAINCVIYKIALKYMKINKISYPQTAEIHIRLLLQQFAHKNFDLR